MKRLKEWIKELYNKLLESYGSVEDEKDLRNVSIIVSVVFWLVILISSQVLPQIIIKYFICVGFAMTLCFFTMYFFRRKKNSWRFKKVKIGFAVVTLIFMVIIMLPMLFVVLVGDIFAGTTNKVYILKRNIQCFFMETLCNVLFLVPIVDLTLERSNNLLALFITYLILIAILKIICKVVRLLFISGKHKHYEIYRYKQEMEIVSEYLFLFVTTISILYNSTDYADLFMPILLWYSLRQIRKYRKEKRYSTCVNAYLMEVLQKLQEIDEIYLESSVNEKIIVAECLGDEKKVVFFKSYNISTKHYHLLKWKQADCALSSIENLMKKEYNILSEKALAQDEIRSVMDDIVKCIN